MFQLTEQNTIFISVYAFTAHHWKQTYIHSMHK